MALPPGHQHYAYGEPQPVYKQPLHQYASNSYPTAPGAAGYVSTAHPHNLAITSQDSYLHAASDVAANTALAPGGRLSTAAAPHSVVASAAPPESALPTPHSPKPDIHIVSTPLYGQQNLLVSHGSHNQPRVHIHASHQPIFHNGIVQQPRVNSGVVHQPIVRLREVHQPLVHLGAPRQSPVHHGSVIQPPVHHGSVHQPTIHYGAVNQPDANHLLVPHPTVQATDSVHHGAPQYEIGCVNQQGFSVPCLG